MGKTCFFLIFLFFLSALAAFAADPFQDLVNAKNLPEGKAFRDEVRWYREEHDSILDAGRHDLSDEAVAGTRIRLTKLLEKTDAAILKDGRNLDLLLFRILLYWDFYESMATDDVDYGTKLVVEALRIESLFQRDYRAYWLLGTFYAYAVRPLESMKQFILAAELNKPEAYPAGFWRAYASAAGFADMPKHALEACRRSAALDKTYVLEDDFVYRIANHFQTPAFDEDILPGSLYQFQDREEGFGLLCRPFGIYIPVDKTWGNRSFEVLENASRLEFTPSEITDQNNVAQTYSIMLEFSAANKIGFEEYVTERLKGYKNVKKLDPAPGNYQFSTYEVADPPGVRPGGGFHGLIAFLDRPEPTVKGFGIERPVVSIFNRETGEPSYRPARAFDRFSGEIYYTVTLDCNDDIFPQAAEVYKSFLQGMLFD